MSWKITITNIELDPAPHVSNIFCHVKIKEDGAADSTAVTIDSAVEVAPDGSIVSPTPLEATGLDDNTSYELIAYTNCDSSFDPFRLVVDPPDPVNGFLDLNISGGGGGSATVRDIDTLVEYTVTATDVVGGLVVPFGTYELISASGSCTSPLVPSVVPAISTQQTLDATTPSFYIEVDCV